MAAEPVRFRRDAQSREPAFCPPLPLPTVRVGLPPAYLSSMDGVIGEHIMKTPCASVRDWNEVPHSRLDASVHDII
jgi:hypothetical protein